MTWGKAIFTTNRVICNKTNRVIDSAMSNATRARMTCSEILQVPWHMRVRFWALFALSLFALCYFWILPLAFCQCAIYNLQFEICKYDLFIVLFTIFFVLLFHFYLQRFFIIQVKSFLFQFLIWYFYFNFILARYICSQ